MLVEHRVTDVPAPGSFGTLHPHKTAPPAGFAAWTLVLWSSPTGGQLRLGNKPAMLGSWQVEHSVPNSSRR